VADEKIEFFAQYRKWVAVKKLAVKDNTTDLEVARFLASANETMHRKMWEFLGKSLDLEKLDAVAAECVSAEKGKKGWQIKGRVGEDRINQGMAKLRNCGKKIDFVENKHGKSLAKQYVMYKGLELLGFSLEPDPKQIEKLQGAKDLAN